MNFGEALEALKAQKRVERKSWNAYNQFIVMMPGFVLPPFNDQSTERKVNDRTAKWIGKDKPMNCQSYLAIHTADEKWQPGWLPNQEDLFAEDWEIVEE